MREVPAQEFLPGGKILQPELPSDGEDRVILVGNTEVYPVSGHKFLRRDLYGDRHRILRHGRQVFHRWLFRGYLGGIQPVDLALRGVQPCFEQIKFTTRGFEYNTRGFKFIPGGFEFIPRCIQPAPFLSRNSSRRAGVTDSQSLELYDIFQVNFVLPPVRRNSL